MRNAIRPYKEAAIKSELIDALEYTTHQLNMVLTNDACTIEAEMREIIEATIADAETTLRKARQ